MGESARVCNTRLKVQPRFVGLLDELAGVQAKCLERIAFDRYEDWHFPAAEFVVSFPAFAAYNIRDDFEFVMRVLLTSDKADEALEQIVKTLHRPDV